jgi:hypothetical protein
MTINTNLTIIKGGLMSNDFNPYAAPSNPGGFGPTGPQGSGGIYPTVVEVGNVLNYAWLVFKANLGLLVGISVVVLGINLGITFVQNIVVGILANQQADALSVVASLAFSLGSFCVQTFLGIGQVQIVLKLLRGQPAEFSDLFAGGPLFLPVLAASFMAGVAVTIGFALCVIPGILLALFFWPFYYLIVDQKAGVIESFSLARSIAQPNAMTTLLLALCSSAAMIIGVIALCVGVIFAIPFISAIWGTAYLMMSGQLAQQPQG